MNRSCSALTLTVVLLAGSARGDTDRWVGGNDRIKVIEFRDVGNNTWEESHNGQSVSRYRVEHVKPHYFTELYDESRDLRVRLWGDRVELLAPGGKGATRIARGGWADKFAKIGPVPLHYHGNYAGAGNRGGVPVDALDRAAQRHDIGYERHGRMDLKTDARLVADATAAAVNPFNDMSAVGRVKAVGTAAVFVPKVVADVVVPPVAPVVKEGAKAVRNGAKAVGKAIGKVFK